jgi:hypothetical protein
MCGLERPNPRESYRIHKTRKKGKSSLRPAFIADAYQFFVDVFLLGRLKVIYEVSRREDYFKKRLRENFPTLNGVFQEASRMGSFRSFQRVNLSAKAVLQTSCRKKR